MEDGEGGAGADAGFSFGVEGGGFISISVGWDGGVGAACFNKGCAGGCFLSISAV